MIYLGVGNSGLKTGHSGCEEGVRAFDRHVQYYSVADKINHGFQSTDQLE
jgi:hypothetical protein